MSNTGVTRSGAFMLRSFSSQRWRSPTVVLPSRCRRLHVAAATRPGEKLKILFCGSDRFSIASLRAVHEYSLAADSIVASIEVATRTDKRTGRGRKIWTPPPIKDVAHDLSLKLHQFDTFTGWTPPNSIDLIVAVSFGLLIPARIINSTRHGGINVHPSLLPDLRGAAPIDWAIIRGYKHTGVSLQTLHPTKFDHGVVLSQSELVDVPGDATTERMIDKLAPLGGNLLVDALKRGLYLPEDRAAVAVRQPLKGSLAPKITPSMKALDYENEDLGMILRKNRTIPKLYTVVTRKAETEDELVKIQLDTSLRSENRNEIPDVVKAKTTIGVPFALTRLGESPSRRAGPIYVPIKSGDFLVVPMIIVPGDKAKPASQASSTNRFFSHSFDVGGYTVHEFSVPLKR